MGRVLLALLGALVVVASAHAKEQLVPAMSAGMRDYLHMLNARDGGINGVKLTWPKKADDARAFTVVYPAITTYWDQAAAMVRYMGEEEGGFEKLRDRKIALLYHDSAYGREPIAVLADLAKKYGYGLSTIPVPPPGSEQQPQWLRIRELRPDWVIVWGWGAMSSAALTSAAKVGYPRGRMLGVWSSGAEEDVAPAGEAAKDFVVAGFHAAGDAYPVIEAIRKHVYAKGGGELADASGIGSLYYNRGVVFGIMTAEAVRVAQRRFGKGRPVGAKQVQWALEHLDLDARRLKALGAADFMPPFESRCGDGAGSGVVRFMRWDGSRWNAISDWVAPLPEDRSRENGSAPRKCSAD